jgi:hypothetical protein
MTNHDAVKRMARVWKLLQTVSELVVSSRAIDCLDEIRKHVYEIGEQKFGKEFIEEVKSQYVDS